MLKRITNQEYKVIFGCGLLWGGMEATLGWYLQFIYHQRFNLFLALAGVLIMLYAVLKTQRVSIALIISIVASAVKSLDITFFHDPSELWIYDQMITIFTIGLLTSSACLVFNQLEVQKQPLLMFLNKKIWK